MPPIRLEQPRDHVEHARLAHTRRAEQHRQSVDRIEGGAYLHVAQPPRDVHVKGHGRPARCAAPARSEEHTTELQSLMRRSYAVYCSKKKITKKHNTQ